MDNRIVYIGNDSESTPSFRAPLHRLIYPESRKIECLVAERTKFCRCARPRDRPHQRIAKQMRFLEAVACVSFGRAHVACDSSVRAHNTQ